ncbi:hypothetical protein GF402_00655 [Candidatus Fermentibacteria bacterium]|nr:hypothetical protein [Candidatus Fermentibacteria bacterium]
MRGKSPVPRRASRLAWSIGASGSLCWMALPMGILLAGGRFLGALCCLAILAGGLFYVYAGAPWKHRGTPFWKIYLGLLGFVLGGGGLIIVLWFGDSMGKLGPRYALCLLPLFLPAFLGGSESS